MLNAFSHFDTNISVLDPDNTLVASTVDRPCNGCTKCCDGWLTSNIYSYQMNENKPCKFSMKGSGCAIYPIRPYNPCKTFKCHWKTNFNIPEKFKPDKSNVIMIYRKYNELEFLDVVRAGPNPSQECLEFTAKLYEKKKVKSVRYLLNGREVKYLSEDKEFIDYVNKTGKYAEEKARD